ncbi:MAG: TolB family protein [Actinomycetota bacterium]
MSVRARREGVVIAFGLIVVLGVGLLPPTVVPTAHATFPGRPGAIVFASLQGPCLTGTGPLTAGPLCDFDIFTVPSNGAAIQQLTQGSEADIQPSWSPDGRRIAFARLHPSFATADIYVMEGDGTGLTNLTQDPVISDYVPAWSPKGDKIVFARRNNPTDPTDVNLHVINADGTGLVQITDTPGIESSPEWSPDGRLIIFARDREASGAAGTPLEVIRPDGSGRRVVTDPGVQAFGPHWSPDGKKILFGSGQSQIQTPFISLAAGEADRDIWMMRRDGTHPQNLTADSDADNLFGIWSPDGKRIAFLSDRDGAYKIYTMRSDGSNVVKLIDIELDASEAGLDWGPRP